MGSGFPFGTDATPRARTPSRIVHRNILARAISARAVDAYSAVARGLSRRPAWRGFDRFSYAILHDALSELLRTDLRLRGRSRTLRGSGGHAQGQGRCVSARNPGRFLLRFGRERECDRTRAA